MKRIKGTRSQRKVEEPQEKGNTGERNAKKVERGA